MRFCFYSVSFIFLAIAAPAFAESTLPLPSAGSYAYGHTFSVLKRNRFELIYSFNEKGRARLQELRALGYGCSLKERDTYLCSTPLPTTGSETLLAPRLARTLAQEALELGALQGTPFLVNTSPILNEWHVPQSVRFRGKTYLFYRLLVLPGLTKIFLGQPAEATFLVETNGNLSYPLDIGVTESRTVYEAYFVTAGFEKM